MQGSERGGETSESGSGVEKASLFGYGHFTWPFSILFGTLTKPSRYATSAIFWGGNSYVICALGFGPQRPLPS